MNLNRMKKSILLLLLAIPALTKAREDNARMYHTLTSYFTPDK